MFPHVEISDARAGWPHHRTGRDLPRHHGAQGRRAEAGRRARTAAHGAQRDRRPDFFQGLRKPVPAAKRRLPAVLQSPASAVSRAQRPGFSRLARTRGWLSRGRSRGRDQRPAGHQSRRTVHDARRPAGLVPHLQISDAQSGGHGCRAGRHLPRHHRAQGRRAPAQRRAHAAAHAHRRDSRSDFFQGPRGPARPRQRRGSRVVWHHRRSVSRQDRV